MQFCSLEYLTFFAAIFTLHWLLPWPKARVWLLLAASFYFYACWNRWLACLIVGTSAADYLVGRTLDWLVHAAARRAVLIASLVMNLGLLCYFKYANFFLDSLGATLRAAGFESSMPFLSVILPVGISFYTFEAINYTVDVYRRKIRAERDLGHFLLFILFFPHLVAGPIVRAKDFLPQIRRRKRWDWARIHLGMQFILMGLFKKLAIADHMAQYADPIFADPGAFRTSAIWMGVIAYAVQIFCDFSGYTDMAIGSAHLLGYRLTKNFNMPYLAVNISDFWRRWHMSLSTWLRDYLFIPLGGSRGTNWQTCRNLFITMTLGGLWHGASWNFVIWGVFHGIALIVHRLAQPFFVSRPQFQSWVESLAGTAARMAVTFAIVCAGWVLFRATSLVMAGTIFERMLIPSAGKTSPLQGLSLWALLAVMAIAHAVGALGLWKRWSVRMPAPALGMAYAFVLNLALLLAPDAGKTFIYFQF
jgi:alginate O-acetyltransferase complex protein AlgI